MGSFRVGYMCFSLVSPCYPLYIYDTYQEMSEHAEMVRYSRSVEGHATLEGQT